VRGMSDLVRSTTVPSRGADTVEESMALRKQRDQARKQLDQLSAEVQQLDSRRAAAEVRKLGRAWGGGWCMWGEIRCKCIPATPPPPSPLPPTGARARPCGPCRGSQDKVAVQEVQLRREQTLRRTFEASLEAMTRRAEASEKALEAAQARSVG
jgi:hypothetical protein